MFESKFGGSLIISRVCNTYTQMCLIPTEKKRTENGKYANEGECTLTVVTHVI